MSEADGGGREGCGLGGMSVEDGAGVWVEFGPSQALLTPPLPLPLAPTLLALSPGSDAGKITGANTSDAESIGASDPAGAGNEIVAADPGGPASDEADEDGVGEITAHASPGDSNTAGGDWEMAVPKAATSSRSHASIWALHGGRGGCGGDGDGGGAARRGDVDATGAATEAAVGIIGPAGVVSLLVEEARPRAGAAEEGTEAAAGTEAGGARRGGGRRAAGKGANEPSRRRWEAWKPTFRRTKLM